MERSLLRCSHSAPGAARIPAIFLALLFVPSLIAAQEYGQWSWEALLDIGGRNRDNLVEGQSGSSFDERHYGLYLGMNGFIVHPAVSRFNIGADLEFIQNRSGRTLNTNRTGFRGNFELFPVGGYRGTLYANRQLFDYAGSLVDDPFTLFAAPDTVTTYGARFRALRGFLKGSQLGIERNGVDFLDSTKREQSRDREFYDWSRTTQRFTHHFRVEHRYRDLGTVNVKLDEVLVNFDERGDFTPTWHWTMAGSGIRQESESFGRNMQEIENYQFRTRLAHDVRDLDILEMNYEFGRYDFDSSQRTDSYSAGVSYRWRPNIRWQFGPLASYSVVSSDVMETRLPRAGVILGWDRTWHAWDSGLVMRGSYGTLEREAAGMTQDERQFGGSLVGRIGHGSMEGLRKEFEVMTVRNRLQITPVAPIVPPGLGFPVPGIGTDDLQRARLTLGHRWDSQFINAWGDWTRRASTPLDSDQTLTYDTLTATVQYGSHQFDLKANVADGEVEESSTNTQSIRSAGVMANWRPWRTLMLRGSYRFDRRKLDSAPNIDGTQFEAGVRWQIGDFFLDTSYLEVTQHFDSGPATTLRTVMWKLTRRFGGWLPIVTGPQRRGVIR